LEIAARMIGSVPDLTRLLDRLEETALLARSRSAEDRRALTDFLARATAN